MNKPSQEKYNLEESMKENNELIAIFVKSIKTAQSKLKEKEFQYSEFDFLNSVFIY